MNYAENKKQQRELADWLADKDWQVFGTLKFTDGATICLADAEKLVQQYFSVLDRAYFGKAVMNVGMRHRRLVFRQMGRSGANLHFHFLAEPHTDAVLFSELARKQWAAMSTWTIGYANTQIGLVRDNRGASNYVLHEYGKLGSDSIFLQASSLNPAKHSPLKYRNLAQLRRLLRLHESENEQTEHNANENYALC